ncbi:MAG: LVIVD repeat-containing protein [Acidimicrobiales bacterium]
MDEPEANHLQLLGHDDLCGTGNCGEGTALLRREGRSYLYIAHERGPVNFSVVDVTDPRTPRVVHQERLPHQQVRSNSLAVAGDLLVVAYQVAVPGLTPAGIEVFDLTRPDEPRSIATLDLSGPSSRGTHWVGFVDGRFAYLSTGTPTSCPGHPRDDQFPVIVDLLEPTHPTVVGTWHLPGTQEGDDAPPPERHPVFDAGFRSHNINVYPERPDRAYVGYLDAGVVILDISDKSAPVPVARLDYHPPMPGFTHTALPLLGRELLAITDECVRDGGADHPKLLWFADMSVESAPLIVSSAPMPPFEDYAHRGGRFGAHNLHENEPHDWSWRSEDIVFGTFFNAGVRAFDVRNPYQPVEVASFVPPPPPGSTLGAAQVNDVYVNAEGIVYATERSGGGLYVLELDQ